MDAGPGGAYDTLVGGDASPAWRERWQVTPALTRAMLCTAGALAVLAVVLAEVAFNSSPRHVSRTVTAAPTSGIVNVDASGCPIRVTCTLDAAPSPPLTAAIRRSFSGATVRSTVSTIDGTSRRVYRRVVVAVDGPTTITVASQCIPGAQPVSRQVLQGDRSFPELDGSTVVRARTVQVVTPGRPGCSASIGADTQNPKANVDLPALRLAADAAVQLR